MKKVIISILLFIILYSCKKGNGNIYTITGHLYQDCSKKPVVGYKLYLHHTDGSYSQLVSTVDNTTTDSAGYFKFTYTSNHNGPLAISDVTVGQNDLIEDIPKETNIDNLQVMLGRPTAHIILSLNVTNAGLLGDSLIIDDFRKGIRAGGGIKLPCPLKSGFVYDAPNVVLSPDMATYTGYRVKAQWMFNSEIGQTQGSTKYFYITKLCTGDTASVVLDVK